MQASSLLSLSSSSPSFSSYSSGKLAEIAARVVEEFRQESSSESIMFDDWTGEKQQEEEKEEVEEEKKIEEEDDEFEFAFVCREPDSSPISADEIFYNGQIRPIYPLFDTTLLADEALITGENVDANSVPPSKPLRLPLRKLMREERESPSCSSSEGDELEGVAPGTYCVWTPKGANQESPGRCKKSNSTGSSKRWKLRDLIYRSNSDGKETFVFLAPSKREKGGNGGADHIDGSDEKAKCKGVEAHYVRGRVAKEVDKRRSYLPYRQDLVGFLSNVNGLSRNLQPF